MGEAGQRAWVPIVHSKPSLPPAPNSPVCLLRLISTSGEPPSQVLQCTANRGELEEATECSSHRSLLSIASHSPLCATRLLRCWLPLLRRVHTATSSSALTAATRHASPLIIPDRNTFHTLLLSAVSTCCGPLNGLPMDLVQSCWLVQPCWLGTFNLAEEGVAPLAHPGHSSILSSFNGALDAAGHQV